MSGSNSMYILYVRQTKSLMANVQKTFKISIPRDQRSQIIQLKIVEI